MINFEFYSPTKIYFGLNRETEVGAIIKQYGFHKILLHYGKSSIKKTGLYDKVIASLKSNNIEYVELAGVEPNPKIDMVRTGCELAKGEKVEMILAVGGGSVIDSSKAIACGTCVDFDPWLFNTHEKIPVKALPVGVILTISAAGSELSNSCVITNTEKKIKNGFNSDLVRPLFAIMNPALTFTVSKYQTACGIVDIMMHTMERYFVEEDSINFTDEIAFGLLKAVIKAGKKVMENPNDFEARASLMLASSFSHNGLTGMGTKMYFTVHRLEHVLSGTYDNVSHGAGLAVLFPAWAKWVYPKLETKFLRFALEVMKVEKQDTNDKTIMAAINKLESFYKELGMPTRFKDLKIDEKAVDELIKKSTNIPSFIKLDSRDIEMIYKNAL